MCTFIGSVRFIEIFSNVLKKSQRETITQVDANYVESHTSQEKHVALSRPERRQALKGRHCKSGKFRKTKKIHWYEVFRKIKKLNNILQIIRYHTLMKISLLIFNVLLNHRSLKSHLKCQESSLWLLKYSRNPGKYKSIELDGKHSRFQE